MKKNLIVVTGLSAFVFGTGALSSAAVYSPLFLPAVKTYKGHPYLSGGIGLDEQAAMRQEAKDDDLQLIFAGKDGHYLSDVQVVITDDKGNKVLEAFAEGPWLFTKLTAGKYTVRATTMGITVEHVVHITPKEQSQLLFTWNESPWRDFTHPLTSR